MREHIIGVVASETSSEISTAADRVTANSRNSRPTMPPMNRMGMKAAISEMVIETTVVATSRTPSSAAWTGESPFSIWRVMFSRTTTASSTTKPVATVSAISDRLLRLKPHRYITASVPISETGTVIAGMKAARRSRRNSMTTMTTRQTEMNRVLPTSRSEARIVVLRSCATSSLISGGIAACSSGMAARMRSTVAMMLAPGCRLIISNTEGLPLVSAALRRSCAPSWTSATSDRRSALPLFQATISGR